MKREAERAGQLPLKGQSRAALDAVLVVRLVLITSLRAAQNLRLGGQQEQQQKHQGQSLHRTSRLAPHSRQ